MQGAGRLPSGAHCLLASLFFDAGVTPSCNIGLSCTILERSMSSKQLNTFAITPVERSCTIGDPTTPACTHDRTHCVSIAAYHQILTTMAKPPSVGAVMYVILLGLGTASNTLAHAQGAVARCCSTTLSVLECSLGLPVSLRHWPPVPLIASVSHSNLCRTLTQHAGMQEM